jgi:hypothetical protein
MGILKHMERMRDYIHTPKGKTVVLLAVLFCAVLGSFFLGRVSAMNIEEQTAVAWCAVAPRIAEEDARASEENTAENSAVQKTYVASKNGSVYHLPWCSGAGRIAEENKRWFASTQEAETAGYRPAKNCPGL